MKKISAKLLSLLFVLVISLAVNSHYKTISEAKKQTLTVSFVDVGQGSATLIQYKGKNVLIDTGEESEYNKLKKFLDSKKVKSISNMIITHNDSDHMGGADLVIKDYKVKMVTRAKYQEKKKNKQITELDSAIRDNRIKTKKVKAGSKIKIASGVQMAVYSPSKKSDESNKNSIVMRLSHGGNSFLFTGDIDANIENALVEKYNLESDVLQVAHHGSGYSSAMLFLSKVSAKYSVISVGEGNPYGHPADFVVKRLGNFSDYIYRTDRNGTVTFTSDGENLDVKTDTVYNDDGNIQKNPGAVSGDNGGGKYIGNVNTKVYHGEHCGNLPIEKNRKYFNSGADAESYGYRAHSACVGR
ncbi:MAG: MBL fold metallo-hydrolase [Lachnospiraceae bacterium]|nr:MBL fold metallo-hydrolase [Lachnospiraceae bacterium]